MKEMLSMKREAFHIKQQKQKRNEILLSKRKAIVPSLENPQNNLDMLFLDIHNELTIDDQLREDRIWTLLKDQKTILEIISALKNNNQNKNPALILHNLCWTSKSESLKILIHNYSIHIVFLQSLQDPLVIDNIQEICLGGICNLLGYFTDEVKLVTEQLIDNGIINYFIKKGNKLISEDSIDILYIKIIQSIWAIYEAVQYFQIERKINSETIIELFKVSMIAVKVKSKKTLTKLLKIALFSSQYINNLAVFLNEEWINNFEDWFQEFIFNDDKQRITLCLEFLKEILYHSQGSEMIKFFQNEKGEYLLFQGSRNNTLLVLQILWRMLESDEFEAFFRLRLGDIISIYEQVTTEEQNIICTKIISTMIETYPIEMIDLGLLNLQQLISIFEDKYSHNTSIPVKIPIINCIINIITNDANIRISRNLLYQLEKDHIIHEDQAFSQLIEELLQIINEQQDDYFV